jgi:hypothetical protein
LRSAASNCLPSSAITVHSVFATAVALRGASVIAASSPNTSPGFTAPTSFRPAISATSPLRSRYILLALASRRLPFSFSLKIVVPAATRSPLPTALKNASATRGS